MIYQVYSVRDSKAAAFALPFFLPRHEVAVRTFNDALADPGHPMSAHPDDYSLYHLGEFDDELGIAQALPEPLLLMTGKVK